MKFYLFLLLFLAFGFASVSVADVNQAQFKLLNLALSDRTHSFQKAEIFRILNYIPVNNETVQLELVSLIGNLESSEPYLEGILAGNALYPSVQKKLAQKLMMVPHLIRIRILRVFEAQSALAESVRPILEDFGGLLKAKRFVPDASLAFSSDLGSKNLKYAQSEIVQTSKKLDNRNLLLPLLEVLKDIGGDSTEAQVFAFRVLMGESDDPLSFDKKDVKRMAWRVLNAAQLTLQTQKEMVLYAQNHLHKAADKVLMILESREKLSLDIIPDLISLTQYNRTFNTSGMNRSVQERARALIHFIDPDYRVPSVAEGAAPLQSTLGICIPLMQTLVSPVEYLFRRESPGMSHTKANTTMLAPVGRPQM